MDAPSLGTAVFRDPCWARFLCCPGRMELMLSKGSFAWSLSYFLPQNLCGQIPFAGEALAAVLFSISVVLSCCWWPSVSVGSMVTQPQFGWLLSVLLTGAASPLPNNISAGSTWGEREGIYWAGDREQKPRLALPLSPSGSISFTGILHSIWGLALSSPISVFLCSIWEEKTVISVYISFFKGWLSSCSSHSQLSHYSQQAQLQTCLTVSQELILLQESLVFPEQFSSAALRHISCLK